MRRRTVHSSKSPAAPQDGHIREMSKAILCLSIYSTICTVIIIALSYVIAQQSSCKMVTDVSGNDNKVKTTAKYDILSFDMSRSKDSSNQCDVWSSLGFQTFKLMVLEMLIIFLAYKIGRKVCGKDGILAKRREAKLQRDAR